LPYQAGRETNAVARSLILFGAGASFGSEEDKTAVPPLTDGLFDALRRYSPDRWGAVDGGYVDQFTADFEKGMKICADACPAQVDELQQTMGAFFFRFEPGPSSLYIRLARCISACSWNGALASLNYERLLELSLRRSGLHVSYYPPELYTDLELCLPHGCCHLFGPIRAAQTARDVAPVNLVAEGPTILQSARAADGTELRTSLRTEQGGPISIAPSVRLDGERPQAIDDALLYCERLRTSTDPPVMSYMRPDKQTRAGVSFIDGQRRRFAELVRGAQTVAIIGVTVRPDDRHIWDCLRDTRARVIYCSGEEAGAEFSSWAAAAGRRGDEIMPCYWAEAFDDLCSRAGIA